MDKFNPDTWTDRFVKENRWECVDAMECLTASIQENLADEEYTAAMLLCNQACVGFYAMVKVWGIEQYGAQLYVYSFLMAEIVMFGIGGGMGKKSALPLLEAAYSLTCDYIKFARRDTQKAKRDAEKMANMMRDIRRGYSLAEIKEEYTPFFPEPWLG